MVKNYPANWILFALLIFFNYSYSQTVSFTGNPSDFSPSQKITGGDGVDYYVSFNATTMFFGAFRTSGAFDPTDRFTIYLDTDPQPIITNGLGSTTGVPTFDHTPQLPFKADRRFTVYNTGTNGTTAHYSYGSNWGTVSGVLTRKTSSTALEIAIPFALLNTSQHTTLGIYYSMFIAQNQENVYYGYSNPEYPISFEGDISTGFFGGIGLTSGVTNPTAHTNTPILHSLVNQHPTAGGKYAYFETDANEGFYTVTGDIELVEGGTAIIGPGSALTVKGTFTNNGLVTLKSQSDKYSSLIATSIDGVGHAQYKRHVNMNSATADNDLVSTPLKGQTFGAFAIDNEGRILANGTQRAFGIFNKDLAKYRNYYTDTNAQTILQPGVGYRAAAIPDGVTSEYGTAFTYTGAIETGEVSIPIRKTATAYSEWNLIGNPYPSYIDIQQLIEHNKLLLDENYVSIHGYAGGGTNKVWEPIGIGAQYSGRLMAPGQGFFVLSNTLGGDFTFTTEMRVPGNTDDFILGRNEAPVDAAGISLTISSGSKSFYTDIFFQNGVTLDHDLGYDIALLDGPSFSIFSKLVEDAGNRNRQLDVQALPYSILDTEVSVPIGIKANQGEQITISAVNMTPTPFPLPENVEVYFEDKVANTSTFLSTSSYNHNQRYIFTPTTNLTGEMGRFFVRFTNKSLSSNNPGFDAIDVFSPLNTGNLVVKGSINEVTKLEIFDLNGRLLQTFSVQPHQSVNRFDVSKFDSGIYIVKLNNKTQSKIKKIQLNNKM